MAIFAVLAAFCYGTLSQTLLSAEILNDRMDRLQALQRTMRMLTDDLQQLAPRPIRDELGDNLRPALDTGFQSGFALELTRGGWSNPVVLPRSTLQRVGYRIEEEELVDFMRKIEYCIQLCIVLSYVKNFYMYCTLIILKYCKIMKQMN